MSGLVDRITEVLRQHKPKARADDITRPGFRIWRDRCSGCSWLDVENEDFEAHVAGLVVGVLTANGWATVRADDITTVLNPGLRFYPGYEAVTERLRAAVSPTQKEPGQ